MRLANAGGDVGSQPVPRLIREPVILEKLSLELGRNRRKCNVSSVVSCRQTRDGTSIAAAGLPIAKMLR